MAEDAGRVIVQIRLSPEEHAALIQAAERVGLSLSEWIRAVASDAAERPKLKLRETIIHAGPRRRIALSMTPAARERFTEAAARHELALSSWLRVVALAAAE